MRKIIIYLLAAFTASFFDLYSMQEKEIIRSRIVQHLANNISSFDDIECIEDHNCATTYSTRVKLDESTYRVDFKKSLGRSIMESYQIYRMESQIGGDDTFVSNNQFFLTIYLSNNKLETFSRDFDIACDFFKKAHNSYLQKTKRK